MVRVAIAVGAYPIDENSRNCYIGISIDDPIPTEFLSQTPEKIWCLYGYSVGMGRNPYLYPKILDIPAGTHTIYVAAYSPPSVPWKVGVFVYGAIQDKIETTWLYKGITDTITINVSSTGAPYTKARLPAWELQELVCDGWTTPPYICEPARAEATFPRIYSAMNCTFEQEFNAECTLAQANVTKINPYKGEQFQVWLPIITKDGVYTFNHLWWNIKEATYPASSRRVSPIPIMCPNPYITDYCNIDCVWLILTDLHSYTPPLYVARDITSSDVVTLQVGHIENDLLPPDQWTYVLDEEKQLNLYSRTDTSCQTPPPPYGASLKIGWIYAVPEAPIDPRPGRRLFIRAFVTNNGTTGCWPMMSVNEGPLALSVADPAPYISPGISTMLSLTTIIDDTIAKQGYVTVNLGYYEPVTYPSGTLIGSMRGHVLQTIQVPFTTTNAQIWDVKLEAVAPLVGARIDNVSLEALAAARAARIDNVSLAAVAPARAARIDNVSLAAVAPPPPPPAEYATIMGRVLGFLGPVANAEVSLDTKYTTKTKADGSYTLTNIPLGSYTLTAKPTNLTDKVLYSPASLKLDVPAPVTITKNINLPMNWKALAAGAGGISIAAVVATTKIKPKPAAVY